MQLFSSQSQVPRRATLQKDLEGMETREKDVGNLGSLQAMFLSSSVGVLKQGIASQIHYLSHSRQMYQKEELNYHCSHHKAI